MSRLLTWTDESSSDYIYWQGQDKKTPFVGFGKPEPLKDNLSGFWSKRIDENNRLVYAVDDGTITIISCRYHYQI